MKITAIKQQVKDTNRASIFVDSAYSFSLTLDQLITEKLKVGLEMQDAELAALKKKSADGKLRMRVLEWLSIRPRSVQETRIYLLKKSTPPEQIDAIIGEMVGKGYLSDMVFCSWFVGLRTRQLKSDREIIFLLRQKGIDGDIAKQVMNDLAIDESDRLSSIIIKKRQTARFKDNEKLLVYLVRKGYSFSAVRVALADD